MAARLDDLSVRTALYHHDKGRVYRPSRLEIETDRFSCPRCGVDLVQVRIRAQERVLSCPGCHWSIHRDDVWQPKLEQEPELRGPGDATEDAAPLDIGLSDLLPPPAEVEIS